MDYLNWLFCATGKTPVVTADVVCFMLDRIFDNWVNEAAYQLDRATALEVDKVAEEFCAAGPLWVVDMSNGNLIVVETNAASRRPGDSYQPAKILESGCAGEWPPAATRRWTYRKRCAASGGRGSRASSSASHWTSCAEGGYSGDLDLGCTLALGFRKARCR